MAAEQFIHPIIEAFVAGRQHAIQKAELAQRGQQFTESQEQAKKLEEERLQKEQEFRDAQLEQAHQTLELSKAMASWQHQSDTLKQLMEARGAGANTGSIQDFLKNGSFSESQFQHLPGTGPAQTPQPQQQSQPIPASGGAPGSDQPQPQAQNQPQQPQQQPQLSPSDLGLDPAARLQQMINFEGAKAGAVSQAQQPAELAKIAAQGTQQQTLEQQKTEAAKAAAKLQQDFESKQEDKRLLNQTNIAKMSRDAQYGVANLLQSGENKRALFNFGLGLPPEANGVGGALGELQAQLATGEIDYDPKNPMQRVAQSANDEHGVIPLGKKGQAELKSLNKLDDLFSQMEDVVKQGSTTAAGAVGQKLLSHVWPTNLENQFNTIMGQMQSVAKSAEDFSGGRILSGQFKSESGSMPEIGRPIQQNLDRIAAIKRNVLNKEQSEVLAGAPQVQRELLKTKGINVPDAMPAGAPDWLKMAPQRNPKGHSLDIQKSIELGQPAYKVQ